MSVTDMSEIARNSVIQSGFSHAQKVEWLGPLYMLTTPDANMLNKSNIPNIRVCFRYALVGSCAISAFHFVLTLDFAGLKSTKANWTLWRRHPASACTCVIASWRRSVQREN